ncbi:MAG: succinate dehydrogenase, hydrophobic membrane anchor protein [Alphaproteobacteria bacterium]|nr:succinate dehydrogenase, hydrophobic membrane anchor protein [Alphaproteobacteria bacterium]
MAMRSMMGHVRGLGSAKEGTHHFWMQRLTAVALVPLTLWFIYSVISLLGKDYTVVQHWASRQINACGLIALVIATFHHAQLGLQVVIEDYVHAEGTKFACLILTKLVAAALTIAGLFAILKLALVEV